MKHIKKITFCNCIGCVLIASSFFLFKEKEFKLLGEEEKESFMYLFDEKFQLLDPLLEKEQGGNTQTRPNFYTVVNKGEYDYLLLHYAMPCNEIYLSSVQQHRSNITVSFKSKNENYDCISPYPPQNKPYVITVTSSEYTEKTIRSFDDVLKESKKNKKQ